MSKKSFQRASQVTDGIDPKLLGGYKHGKGDWLRPRGQSISQEEYNNKFDKIFKQGEYEERS